MFKSAVYQGVELLDEVEVYPPPLQRPGGGGDEVEEKKRKLLMEEVLKDRIRISHLSQPSERCLLRAVLHTITGNFKMETKSKDTQISLLHSSCIRDNKTAVMPLGDVELHLVAMYSRNNDREYPCFWDFSFVQDDKNILKQYVDNDQVINNNGKVMKAQHETVPALSDNHPPLVRPLIHLPEKNIILTRINPGIRDTSVLVRLRPAWEDMQSYLTARGWKRFEVYLCTMTERDYALEMWRLLDPESNLIGTHELLNRIVCVKSGLRKSLFDVFQDGTCHPKMALVVDDRLKVWDEKTNLGNREFDDGLLQKGPEIAYEDDISSIPPPLDVSGFMTSEEDASIPPGTHDNLFFDGMAENKDAMPASTLASALANLDPRIVASLKSEIASSSIILPATQSVGGTISHCPATSSGLVTQAIQPG
ncbi:hypothetical protein MLD38_019355 [Melastoma candidum]|uniref:Uncharacterized protein n=1 Tax=Melastoma candidum TaxID=119954 RepID=A0ACB9QWP4_9MYRT|nr:hypothetical protein MLD38_019355 [Melastoma candidum]